jgi:hypothetical protein
MKNISLLTILVVKQSDSGVAIGIILNRSNLGWNRMLVAAEINHAIEAFMATTTVTASNDAPVVPPLGTVN